MLRAGGVANERGKAGLLSDLVTLRLDTARPSGVPYFSARFSLRQLEVERRLGVTAERNPKERLFLTIERQEPPCVFTRHGLALWRGGFARGALRRARRAISRRIVNG